MAAVLHNMLACGARQREVAVRLVLMVCHSAVVRTASCSAAQEQPRLTEGRANVGPVAMYDGSREVTLFQ